MPTTIGQDCNSQYDTDGKLKFYIETTVDEVLAGDLPGPAIFVFKVVVSTDPKSDKFLRIGNIVDLTTLEFGRDAAIAAGAIYFLAPTFEVQFDDVATATKAKNEIIARIDALIADWILYQTQFTIPASTALPTILPTIVTEAKADYVAAKGIHGEKEVALAAADAAVSSAQVAATTAQTNLVDATAASILCSQNTTLLNLGVTAADVLKNDAVYLLAAVETVVAQLVPDVVLTPTEYTLTALQYTTFIGVLNASYRTAIPAHVQSLGALTAAQSAITTECGDALAAVTAKATLKISADTALATANTAQVTAQAVETQAEAAEAVALAAVLAVCPDFDPESV